VWCAIHFKTYLQRFPFVAHIGLGFSTGFFIPERKSGMETDRARKPIEQRDEQKELMEVLDQDSHCAKICSRAGSLFHLQNQTDEKFRLKFTFTKIVKL
jgi:hypothetical protein